MAKIILRAGKVAIKIIIPFVVLGLIFCSIKMLTPAKAQTEPGQSELADELALAQTYQEQGHYAEAELIYQGITEQYPGTDDALAGQTQLVILYINWDRPADAEAALQQLTSSFYEHPGIAQAVYDIADCYGEEHKDYEKALQIHQYVLANWPDSESAIWSQADIAVCNINLKDEAAADAAIEKLVTDFSTSKHIAQAVYDIAHHYGQVHKEYEKARQLYQLVADNWPDSNDNDAIWARAVQIRADIALGTDSNTPGAVDELLKQFSENEFITDVVCSIADSCYDAGRYEDSRRLYQLAADKWPGNDEAIWTRAGSINANIALGNDTNIQEALDEFIAEFADIPDLPEALCVIGEEYGVKAYEVKSKGLGIEAKEYFQKAIDLWERVIREFPDCDVIPRAYYCSAGCYELELSEYEKAIEYYQKVLDNWPYFDYRRASYAQFGIARCYQNLEKSGRISMKEAANRIRQACNNLLANYPETNPVIIRAAGKLLDEYQVSK